MFHLPEQNRFRVFILRAPDYDRFQIFKSAGKGIGIGGDEFPVNSPRLSGFLAIKMPRNRTDMKNRSPGIRKAFQQSKGCAADCPELRQKNRPVLRLSDPEPSVLRGTALLHDKLVAVIESDPRPEQRIAQTRQPASLRLTVLPRVSFQRLPEPGRFQRMNHEQRTHRLPFRKQTAEAFRVILQMFFLLPVRRLKRDSRRKIPFCFAPQSVKRMMHAENRNSERVLPVHSRLLREERQIPSRSGERFAEHVRRPVLARHGRRLERRIVNQLTVAEHIKSGDVHMPHEPHDVSRVFRLSDRVFLPEDMSGVKQSVFSAPLRNGNGEGRFQQFRTQIRHLPADF